ncbi:hypothetical protein HDV03_003982 [Kappamyces sp. JEL0829]|nr:hypothetical protein HDV03_003982 [Kappamyces sp. JEL0829]
MLRNSSFPGDTETSTFDNDEFVGSSQTRSYLQGQKDGEVGFIPSSVLERADGAVLKEKQSRTSLGSQPGAGHRQDEDDTATVAAFASLLAKKRQSAIGSYLFGTDVRTFADMETTLNGIGRTTPTPAPAPAMSVGPEFEEQDSSSSPAPLSQSKLSVQPTLASLSLQSQSLASRIHSQEERDDEIVDVLCGVEEGFAMLLGRVKDSMANAKDAAAFLKRRAALEADYAQGLVKLGHGNYGPPSALPRDSKTAPATPSSFSSGWGRMEKMHIKLGELRLAFSKSIGEMGDNIQVLYKNTERSRKQLKESALRHQKELQEVEDNLERARQKFEAASETWERTQGAPVDASRKNHPSFKGFASQYQVFKARIQQDLKLGPKTEEEARQRAAAANSTYKQCLALANTARQTYVTHHLPRFIRALKEAHDNCDEGVVKYMAKYAKSVEDMVMVEATTVSPLDGGEIGLLALVEAIDCHADFDTFMETFLKKIKRGSNKHENKYLSFASSKLVSALPSPGAMTSSPLSASHASMPNLQFSENYFGATLVDLMEASDDGNPIPTIVTNTVEYIEASGGLSQEGLYRLSGSGSMVQQLRSHLDSNPGFALEDVVQDIHTVTGVLKLFFRELRDPLFPREMFKDIIAAIKLEDPRLKLIKVHEQINLLHDANYATLKYLSCHLARVAAHDSVNKMSAANLGIVWGPTLLDSGLTPDASDLKYSSEVVELIISNVSQIFETE